LQEVTFGPQERGHQDDLSETVEDGKEDDAASRKKRRKKAKKNKKKKSKKNKRKRTECENQEYET